MSSSTNSTSSDISIIVRSANERTEELCVQLIREQIDTKDVVVIHERPFAKAHEKSIRVAAEIGAKWSVFVDADLLLRSNAFQIIQRGIEQYEHIPWFKMNFVVLDRGFGGGSYGVHCYRTELFIKAVSLIEITYDDQRPETRLANEMGKRGYPTILSTMVVALHDYEQYYRDLYRKMYVRGIKFNRLSDYMRSIYEESYVTDPEYRVMLWGLMDGLIDRAAGITYAPLDSEHQAYQKRSAQILEMLQLSEKPSISLSDKLSNPDEIIDTFQPSNLYLANRHRLLVPQKDQILTFGRDVPFHKRVLRETKRAVRGRLPFLAQLYRRIT